MRRSPARHVLQAPQYPPPFYYPQPAPAPERQRGNVVATICTIVLTLVALIVGGVFLYRVTGGVLPTFQTQPTRAVGVIPSVGITRDVSAPAQAEIDAHNAAAEAEHAAAIQAGEQAAQPQLAPAAVDMLGIPTAVILIPTALPIDQVRVIPRGMPVLAGAQPTAIPTMVYPTPLPAAVADDFEVSPDGTCITAPRDGKRYQVCQDWKYQPQELATVADLIRGGTLVGVEVE